MCKEATPILFADDTILFFVENSYVNLNHTSMVSYAIYLDGWKPINCLYI